MQSVEVVQLDGMRFAVRRGEAEVIVDRAPADGGPDPTFRSGELLLGALGTCTLGSLVVFAGNTGVDLSSLRATVSAEESDAPKCLEDISIAVHWDSEVPKRRIQSLERVAHRCKIHTTLASSPAIALKLPHG